MKTFTTQAVLRHPLEVTLRHLRDQLPRLAATTKEPTAVETRQRSIREDGSLFLENVWRVEVDIPNLLQPLLSQDMLAWTDWATWHPSEPRCQWRVEPHFHSEHVQCTGQTTLSPAMAGRGTRVAFSGAFEVTDARLPGVPPMLQEPAAQALEILVASAIPRGFRKLVAAVGSAPEA